MDIISELIFTPSVAQSVFVIAAVITIGVLLNRITIKGISLGVTWILFVGILAGHYGITLEPMILQFVKEFGMILFIYGIGMLVGPSFFSSFKSGGVQLNIIATIVVLVGLLLVVLLYYTTELPITTFMGVFSGAVTNTPGLGAAQETVRSITQDVAPANMGVGYAIAYPVAIICMILTQNLIKPIFRINIKKEEERLEAEREAQHTDAVVFSLEVKNPAIFGKNLYELSHLLGHKDVVISRILHRADGQLEFATSHSRLFEGDRVLAVAMEREVDRISAFIGPRVEMTDADWTKLDENLVSRRCLVSRPKVVGRSIADLKLRSLYHVNISRVYRSELTLIAEPNLTLQLGDAVVVVGQKEHVNAVERLLGNSQSALEVPNVLVIFLGILLGVVVGSIPLAIPHIPVPVRLGLAGGTLVVAILMSNFGTRFKLNTYNTQSANLLMRDMGISFFLACVGLNAGTHFFETLMGGGYLWMLYAALFSLVPVWVGLFVGRKIFKIDYFTMIGLVAGSLTFAAALQLSPDAGRNNVASVRYATIYPLVMFLRVITAQWVILLFM